MSDGVRDLLVHGIAAAKAGEKNEARRYLERALWQDPTTDQRIKAWFWLSEVTDEPGEKRRLLEQVLSAIPNYGPALRSLAILDGKLKPEQIIDPNRLPATRLQAGVDASKLACPVCGGRLSYSPDGSALVCDYCEARHVPVGADRPVPSETSDFTVAMATLAGHAHPSLERSFTCEACGAPFTLDADDLSVACPYCASPHVVQNAGNAQVFEIRALIPAMVTQRQALDALRGWLLSRRARGKAQVLAAQGVYEPAWLFQISAPLTGRRLSNDFRPVEDLQSVVVPACCGLPPAWQEAFNSFNLSSLAPFDPAYLAGWQAETYQVSLADASLAARFLALEQRPRPGFRSMDLIIAAFHLILLPFWRVTYIHKGSQSEALINAQTASVW